MRIGFPQTKGAGPRPRLYTSAKWLSNIQNSSRRYSPGRVFAMGSTLIDLVLPTAAPSISELSPESPGSSISADPISGYMGERVLGYSETTLVIGHTAPSINLAALHTFECVLYSTRL